MIRPPSCMPLEPLPAAQTCIRSVCDERLTGSTMTDRAVSRAARGLPAMSVPVSLTERPMYHLRCCLVGSKTPQWTGA